MKLVKSSKLLTAACALSLTMGVVGTGHAAKFSIDAEAFCGNPAMVPIYDTYGDVIGYEPDVTQNWVSANGRKSPLD